MRIRTFILIVLKAALIAFAVAQSSVAKTTPDVAATGSVTGHVFLPESNLPARFASVALQQVGMKPQAGRDSGSEDAAREYDGGVVPVVIHGKMTGVTIPVSEKRMPVKSAMAGTL